MHRSGARPAPCSGQRELGWSILNSKPRTALPTSCTSTSTRLATIAAECFGGLAGRAWCRVFAFGEARAGCRCGSSRLSSFKRMTLMRALMGPRACM